MKTVATAIPDDLAPQQGEEIQFQALVQEDGSLLVTRVLHRETTATRSEPKMTLSEWAQQWAGSMKLKPDETYEDLRRAAYSKKFGQFGVGDPERAAAQSGARGIDGSSSDVGFS